MFPHDTGKNFSIVMSGDQFCFRIMKTALFRGDIQTNLIYQQVRHAMIYLRTIIAFQVLFLGQTETCKPDVGKTVETWGGKLPTGVYCFLSPLELRNLTANVSLIQKATRSKVFRPFKSAIVYGISL